MKKYGVTPHAVDRAVERLGRHREHAHSQLSVLMQTAVYQGSTGSGRIYDHYRTRTRLILDSRRDVIITVYSMDSEKPEKWNDGVPTQDEHSPKLCFKENAFIASFQTVIQRELTKAQRQFTREYRKLAESNAVIGLEIAQLTLNKARARSPVTQGIIQRKIDDLHAQAVRMDVEKGELEAQFRAMKSEVSGLIGTEVGD